MDQRRACPPCKRTAPMRKAFGTGSLQVRPLPFAESFVPKALGRTLTVNRKEGMMDRTIKNGGIFVEKTNEKHYDSNDGR